MHQYLERWRPILVKRADEPTNIFFLTINGGQLTSGILDAIIKDLWPLEKPKFGFTDLRKSSHTAYDLISHERANEHLFYSGANHT